MKHVIDNCLIFVKDFFKNESSGHDYFHTLRVYNLASHIGEIENANLDIVKRSALLHDVDDYKLSKNTYKNKDNARKFLTENNIDDKTIDLICTIIDEISYKGTDSVTPTSIEGKVVQDADRLDAIGAIGIARCFTFGGHHNRVMYDPDILPNLSMNQNEYRNHISTTLNHFYEKLFNLKDLMNTTTAKNIAIQRDNYMKEFINQFLNEWNGIK